MTALWRHVQAIHNHYNWPERLTILVLLLIAVAKAALVAGD